MSEVEEVAEALGDHHGVLFYNGVWCCTCLIVLANTTDVGPDRPPLTVVLHRSAAIRGRMFMLEDGDEIQWFRIASVVETDRDGSVVAVLEPVHR